MDSSSRTKKLALNISTSMLYQLTSIVCGLITPRLILSAFGSTYNGVINSAAQFLNVVSILNIGIAGATRVALYKTLAFNKNAETSRIIKATKLYMRKVAVVLATYSLILMAVFPYISHTELSKPECAALVGIVSLATFGEFFFGITNNAILSAAQMEYIFRTLDEVFLILNTVAVFLMIKLGRGVLEVQLVSAIIFLTKPILLDWYVKKRFKLNLHCEPNNEALNKRKAVAYHSIANIIHDRTDILILTLFTDIKIVSVYAVYYLVAGKIKSLFTIFTGGIEGAFGEMLVKREDDTLRKTFNAYEIGLFMLISVAFSCMGVLFIPFIRLYTIFVTDTNYILPSLAYLITVTEAVYCIRQPYLLLVQAAGLYEETKNWAVAEAIINLVASVILVNLIGINGVIIGTLLANLIRTTQFVYFSSRKILLRPLRTALLRVLWIFANAAAIIAVSLIIGRFIPIGTAWLKWAWYGIACSAAAVAIVAVSAYLFFREEVTYIIGKVKTVLIKS